MEKEGKRENIRRKDVSLDGRIWTALSDADVQQLIVPEPTRLWSNEHISAANAKCKSWSVWKCKICHLVTTHQQARENLVYSTRHTKIFKYTISWHNGVSVNSEDTATNFKYIVVSDCHHSLLPCRCAGIV